MTGSHPLAALRSAAPAIVPSLLLCDFGHLADEIGALESAGVAALHFDVMDGHFVPNLTYGMPIVAAADRASNLPLDVHLMISRPEQYVEAFRAAGADLITFHVEAVDEPRHLLAHLRKMGVAAGIALNPSTPLEAITSCLDQCDMVLVMSVQPGFGGQSFDRGALDKLRQLRAMCEGGPLLAVDGGVNETTIADCAQAGAEVHVVGSAIFSQPDYAAAVAALKRHALTRWRK